MAWPNNSFWEAMQGLNGPPRHSSHGAGVDHAPPPSPPFMSPGFWNWSQSGPSQGSWGHGRRGGRHGRHHHGRHNGEDAFERGGGEPHDATDDETFPPEYISDGEVAAATAAVEAEKKGKGAGDEKDASPDMLMQDDAEDPPEGIPTNLDEPGRPQRCGGHHGRRGGRGSGFGREGFGCSHHKRGGPRRTHGGHHGGPSPPLFGGPFGAFGGGMFGGPRHHSRGAHDHPHHHGPPSQGPGDAFDLRGLLATLANHPAAQQVREYIERLQQGQAAARGNSDYREMTPGSSDDEDGMGASFSPPLDLFEQANCWILHLAVPGAKKEDIGVNFDVDRSVLSISGVVYRPGDEQFLQGLVSGERSVGLFSREVRLLPTDKNAKEEVDSEGIEAKLEDGVLLITVPKVEKDCAEVKRVMIQ